MSDGWIKLHRKLIGSQMYKNLNSKQRDVMIQCLLMANHQENEWEWGQEKYVCRPGQFITSLENIREKCGCDVKVQSVRTALLKLEKWGFLTNESTKTGRLISIVKWDLYQNCETDTNKDINKQPTKSQQRANKELTTNKNDKNDKNEKNVKNEENIISSNPPIHDFTQQNFDSFWKEYPRKVNKEGAWKSFKSLKPSPDLFLKIMDALKRHCVLWSSREKEFIPHASTWLNKKRWEDEITVPFNPGITDSRDTDLVYMYERGMGKLSDEAKEEARALIARGVRATGT
ncbi:MAG TPA: hypothetical protein VLH56_11485 [Dissulfurispiraceae bacterium]|nr:hypothetical protein [Dissulfurispiraceae bacterium]